MRALDRYVPVVLFIILYKVVLTFASVNKILECDYPNKNFEQYFSVIMFIML